MTRHPTPDLSAIRAIVCAEIDGAMLSAQRLASPDASMPAHLLQACLWIADQAEFPACDGERYFAWSPETQRDYLDRLTHEQRTQELASGYRVLFEGSTPLVSYTLAECVGDPMKVAA